MSIIFFIADICKNIYRIISHILRENQIFFTQIALFYLTRLPEPRDYFQVFELKPAGNLQSITHTSEKPEYRMEYLIPTDSPITEKLYIIDDGDHSTMLLASEY